MDNYDVLEKLFMEAVEVNNKGKADEAATLFRKVLDGDPRLAEPRLELATICLRRNQLEEAEEQAREALQQLERGWRWLDVMTDEQMLGHACNLLAEILKARSTSDEVMAQGETAMRELWGEAGDLIERAAEYDPENPDIMANYYGFKKARPPRPRPTSGR